MKTVSLASLLTRFRGDCGGATAIEYALIVSGIAIVIVGSVTTVGTNLDTIFNSVAGGFN
jgi:pilus assembly protein Flp/PilA